MHFNIALPCIPLPPIWNLSSGFPTENESMIYLRRVENSTLEKTVGYWNWHCRLDVVQIVQCMP
jgi:hypothetical protein